MQVVKSLATTNGILTEQFGIGLKYFNWQKIADYRGVFLGTAHPGKFRETVERCWT